MDNLLNDLLITNDDVRKSLLGSCRSWAQGVGLGAPVIPVASICSGLGVAEMVYDALNFALSNHWESDVQAMQKLAV